LQEVLFLPDFLLLIFRIHTGKGGDQKNRRQKSNRKEVIVIINILKRIDLKKKILVEKGQSTMEYALVMVVAGIISAVLVAVGKPMIIEIISKVFNKIAQMV
jgi:Flp pilus assembly pilin Flp